LRAWPNLLVRWRRGCCSKLNNHKERVALAGFCFVGLLVPRAQFECSVFDPLANMSTGLHGKFVPDLSAVLLFSWLAAVILLALASGTKHSGRQYYPPPSHFPYNNQPCGALRDTKVSMGCYCCESRHDVSHEQRVIRMTHKHVAIYDPSVEVVRTMETLDVPECLINQLFHRGKLRLRGQVQTFAVVYMRVC
jgi:hypothetical protein